MNRHEERRAQAHIGIVWNNVKFLLDCGEEVQGIAESSLHNLP